MRIAQRTLLTYDEIAFILDKGYFVDTGTEPGFNRDHLVFYSHKDQTCFVAIRDHYSGKTVTILPLEYHKNLAWPISERVLGKAKEIYPFHLLDENLKEQSNLDKKTSSSRIYLTFHFLDKEEKRKSKPLMSVASESNCEDLNIVIKDVDGYKLAQEKAKDLHITQERILGVSIKVGKKGSMQFFDLEDLKLMCQDQA